MRLFIPMFMLLVIAVDFLGAQNSLALENMRKFKRRTFSQGETFVFKTPDTKRWIDGQIGTVYDSSVMIVKSISYYDGDIERQTVFKDEIPLSRIQYVRFPDGLNGNASGIGPVACWGGLALIGVFGVNKLLIGDGDSAGFDGSSFIIAGGLSLTGLTLMLARNRKVKVKGNWRLRTMPPMTPLIGSEGPQ